MNTNLKFCTIRKGDKFFKAVWKGDPKPQFMCGRDVAEAFNNAGIGAGALPALDYHAQVYPCLECDFVGDSPAEKRKHRCVKFEPLPIDDERGGVTAWRRNARELEYDK